MKNAPNRLHTNYMAYRLLPLIFIVLGSVSFLLSGCSSLESQIVGTWRLEAPGESYNGEIVEFRKDGTIVTGEETGYYHFIDDNRMRFQMGSTDLILEVSIESNQLVLEIENRTFQIFTRVR
jgi:hypothetical protein